MRLRVVSWNVHGCVGTDGVFDPRRTARVLAALGCDVAFLQEVGDNRGIHPPVDQASALAQALGLRCVVGVTLQSEPYGYGNCTLSRYEVLDTESVDLSVRGREPRLCLRVRLGHEAARITTLNVHFGLDPRERWRQLGRLRPLLDRREPLVLAGDFNDFPTGPVTFRLGRALRDLGTRAAPRRTFPSRWPLLRLDRLYATPALGAKTVWVERSAAARLASDHLPLVADLELAAVDEAAR